MAWTRRQVGLVRRPDGQLEVFSRPSPPDTVNYLDLFKGTTSTGAPIKTILTKGEAGVGKTRLTQMFSKAWVEGKVSSDIQLLFNMSFRELNVLRDTEFSLMEFMHRFHKVPRSIFSFQCIGVLFIMDGLNEYEPPLDFANTRVVTSADEKATVEELLVNLIRGDLVTHARIWITSRPETARHIPDQYISLSTDSRKGSPRPGELVKVETRTRIYIPVFCWVASTIYYMFLKQKQRGVLSQSLTEMYTYLLLVLNRVKNYRYHGEIDPYWDDHSHGIIVTLGHLALKMLLKGSIMFYEPDLRPVEVAEMLHAGIIGKVCRRSGRILETVYFFTHLNLQTFLAALHAHDIYFSNGPNRMAPEQDRPKSATEFYSCALELALKSPNGHMDLFLRYLLGMALPSNQALLPGLLTYTKTDWNNHETVKKIRASLSTEEVSEERTDLLSALNEQYDLSLLRNINSDLLKGDLAWFKSPTLWPTLSFILGSTDPALDQLDLVRHWTPQCILDQLRTVHDTHTKKSRAVFRHGVFAPLTSFFSLTDLTVLDLSYNHLQDKGVEVLCSAMKSAPCRLQSLSLACCALTSLSCVRVASVLSSISLTLLDLSNNDLEDTGMTLLSTRLKNDSCRLETLRLSGCLISERGGASLAEALSSTPSESSTPSSESSAPSIPSSAPSTPSSAPSTPSSASCSLRELDLSYNNPGASAELLTALKDDPQHSLKTLRLDPAGEQWMVPGLRKYSCEVDLDPSTAQKNLRLSEQRRTATAVTAVTAGQRIAVREEHEKEDAEDEHSDHDCVSDKSDAQKEARPEHEERFVDEPQVLSSCGLRGRCYWEVQWSDWSKYGRDINIAVSYRGIARSGDESRFGENDQSWTLSVCQGNYEVVHNVIGLHLLTGAPSGSGRVSVFLDTEAGTLSYFLVESGGRLRHLHTFTATFSEPLFPGFRLEDEGVSVTVVDLQNQRQTS